MTLRIYHVDFIVSYQCKLLNLQHYILWLCLLSMICISRTYFISCWDYIHITYIHEDDKGIRNFNHLSPKANLKHIILSEPLLSLFIFSFSHFTLFLSFSNIPFLLFQHWRQCCVLCVGVLGECWFSNFGFICYFSKKKTRKNYVWSFELPLVFENMSIMYEN